MSLYRLLLRSLHQRREYFTATQPLSGSFIHHILPNASDSDSCLTPAQRQARRSFAFSSAEEAAAERRRRKRRLRIEPPLHALRSQHANPPPNSGPPRPALPDSTSALVGPRLNLHNRVQSLIRASDLDAAALLARRSVFSNIRPTVFTCNAIIAAMYRGKRYDDAIALFHYFFNQSNIIPNVVSYNNLINAHCDKSEVDTALQVYGHIIANAPFSPSHVTYRHLTKGLIESNRIGEAVDLLREMLNKGHGADSLVYNNLISGFLEMGNLDKANELFDELKERCLVYDGVVNATYMDWFFRQGRDKEAMESYKSLMDRGFKMVPATRNVLLETLLKHGKKAEASYLFEQMLDDHTPPNFQAVNSDTFNIMVNECFKLGKFAEAVDTFKKVGTKPGSRPFTMDVAGYSNIIVRFCENGMLTEAERFFTELCSKSLSPDATSYRTLIDTYLKMERVDDALQMLNKMVEARLRVVVGFGTRVFGGLIKNGKAVDSAHVLLKMGEQDPKPDALIYDVVVRGLCDEDAFDIARDVLDQAMRQNVGVTPALEAFVRDAFGKVGRVQEIQNLLDPNRWGLSRPLQMGGQTQSRPPQFQGLQRFGPP
ncbi:ACT11D09.4 [Tripterygium wilfordii]|uniref:ACT11D09.4 n=1 Tax=Tripterygium wilfordii TaxID=458696 RepID=A0A7J7D809_TRIWF|nr:pentatricopeptide repeat-containing protein At1g10270-like [Tripterygium wilfordii]KAF5742500.1 ACT11D09.4 [Tripterygium wilfordii]